MFVNIYPDRNPRHQEAQGSPGKDSGDWILPDLAGPEQPGMELWRVDKSVKLAYMISHNYYSCICQTLT